MSWLHMAFWMLAVLATWVAGAALLIGWGLLIGRALKWRVYGAGDVLNSFWLGLCGLLAFLQIYHLFFAINGYAEIPLVVLGILGWFVGRGRDCLAVLLQTPFQHPRATLLAACTACWFANHALGFPQVYDTGLYHLQAIRWAQEFPLVIGLGNLHGRLAFNNSCFLLDALAMQGAWHDSGFGLVNGLLMLVLVVQSALALYRLSNNASQSVTADTFTAALLLPLALICLPLSGFWLSSVASDLSTMLFYFGALIYTAGALASSRRPRPGQISEKTLLACALAAAAVCSKLSSAPVALGLCALVMGAAAFRGERLADHWIRTLLISSTAVALLIIPWMMRGILLSGYPLYPSAALAVNVPWRVPPGAAQNDLAWITAWARDPGVKSISAGPWFGAWLDHNKVDLAEPIGLAIFLAIVAVARGRTWPRATSVAVLAAVALGLIVWFISAPDPRFAFHLLWTLPALGLTWAILGTRSVRSPSLAARRLTACLLVLIAGELIIRGLRADALGRTLLVAVVSFPQNPDGLPHVPPSAFEPRLTDSGLTVYVPASPATSAGVIADDRAWDAPLPSTPQFHRSLRLRQDNNLAAGFLAIAADERLTDAPSH